MDQSVVGETDAAGYNYAYFDQLVATEGDVADEVEFSRSFHAGEPAEDFSLVRLDDNGQQKLSELWKTKPLVMEFGSFT
jgi:hypothetical protein